MMPKQRNLDPKQAKDNLAGTAFRVLGRGGGGRDRRKRGKCYAGRNIYSASTTEVWRPCRCHEEDEAVSRWKGECNFLRRRKRVDAP